MLEADNMKHLEEIEKVATAIGLPNRRFDVRGFVAIQVLEPSGEWVLFDPIRKAKDVSKMIYAAYKKSGAKDLEVDFRLKLLKEILNHDFTVQKER